MQTMPFSQVIGACLQGLCSLQEVQEPCRIPRDICVSVHINEKALDTLGNFCIGWFFFLRFEDVCVRACMLACVHEKERQRERGRRLERFHQIDTSLRAYRVSWLLHTSDPCDFDWLLCKGTLPDASAKIRWILGCLSLSAGISHETTVTAYYILWHACVCRNKYAPIHI